MKHKLRTQHICLPDLIYSVTDFSDSGNTSEFSLEDESATTAVLAVLDACVMTSEFEYCEEDFMTYSSRRSSTNEISPLIEETVECGSDVSDDMSMGVCFSGDTSSTFDPSLNIFQGTEGHITFKFDLFLVKV